MNYSLWGLFVSAFISSTIAPGGSEAFLAYLVVEGDYSNFMLVSVASVGNTLGALTTWALGLFAAKKYPSGRVFSKKQHKAIARIQKWGPLALLFSWLPIIGDALCFAGGWLKLPFMTSLLFMFSGKVVRYLFVAYLFAS
ncbi:MAG: YqaA family protein [Methylococcaceae bacterium]